MTAAGLLPFFQQVGNERRWEERLRGRLTEGEKEKGIVFVTHAVMPARRFNRGEDTVCRQSGRARL